MKHFTMTVAGQSLRFTEEDIDTIQAALVDATQRPGARIQRYGASGLVSVVMLDDRHAANDTAAIEVDY
ncbi:hypothetical protein [Halotalea alkalilenta]|uniref:Uncharacterized protein n=1 Tax=Halotalea alkalilenta TaxID=376489 RepID=A0A172YAS1_9GAMM|nr:hypothetical protein [Halotalea alkalilenta]ANF56351.1 hypothetical protein A5892_01810 [Halotalea alkalilenta]